MLTPVYGAVCAPLANSTKIVKSVASGKELLPKYQNGIAPACRQRQVQKDENSCEMHQVESTNLSQRQIHGDVRTKAGKEAVWRITAQRLL